MNQNGLGTPRFKLDDCEDFLERLHLLIWHLLPALLLTALSAIGGAVWLWFRPRLSKFLRAG